MDKIFFFISALCLIGACGIISHIVAKKTVESELKKKNVTPRRWSLK